MRILNVADIVNGTAGMPVKAGTWMHIQNAYTELLAELVNDMHPNLDTTQINVLRGVNNSFVFSDGLSYSYNVNAGAILYNGEIFLVPATRFTTENPNYAVMAIQTTQFTGTDSAGYQYGDPVLFSNNVYNQIMNIRMMIACDSSEVPHNATVVCNYNDLVTVSPVINQSSLVSDAWHYVDDNTDALYTGGFQNGYTNEGITHVGFVKEGVIMPPPNTITGRVQLVGVAGPTSSGIRTNVLMFTLPAGYRLGTALTYPVYDNGSNTWMSFTLNTDGTFTVTCGGETSGAINLNNISFLAEN